MVRVIPLLPRKVIKMRLIVGLSTVAVIGLSSSAIASESASSQIPAVNLTQPLQSPEVRSSASPVGNDPVLARAGRSSGGFFSRLMQIERRKNAWFRSMFR